MKTRFRIIAAAIVLLTLGLTIILQQTGIVSADDITVTITGPSGPTNISPIPLTITFNADVTEFELDDIDVVNGTAGNLAGEGDEYTVDITPTVPEGLVTVDIGENVVAENNAAAETYSIYYDSVAPTVTITSTSPDPTGNPIIPFTITFSEDVDIFDPDDIVVTNGVKTDYSFGASESTLLVQATTFGPVKVDIAAGVVFDEAGNPNEVSESFSILFTDQPWVAVEQASGQEDPTCTSPIMFDVIFSEAVTGFELEDVAITGSAPGVLIAEVSGEDDRYTVSVSGMTGPGTVMVSVPEGAAEDMDENETLASTSTDNEVTFKGPAPTVVSIARIDVNPTKEASIGFYIIFSENVDDVDVDDFELTATGTLSGVSIQNVVGTGNQRFVSVLTGSGAGTLRLDVPGDAEIFDSDDCPLDGLPFATGEAYDVRLESFADVGTDHWAWMQIEQLFTAGVTQGCSTTPTMLFCPDLDVTRAEMAKFILVAINGDGYTPSVDVTEGTSFSDVAGDYWAAAWIEQLYQDDLTDGCSQSPLAFCPNAKVSRAEMAKFLLTAIHADDPDYEPDAVVGSSFADISSDYWAIDWVEALYDAGVTTGCSQTPLNYCPESNVTRAEMAVFLVRAFELP
jgi:hypothetical protein